MGYPVALIDLGSNAVRLVLAEITPGTGYRILRKARAQTRLGSGVNGHLSPRAVRDTLEAVRGFLQTLPQGSQAFTHRGPVEAGPEFGEAPAPLARDLPLHLDEAP